MLFASADVGVDQLSDDPNPLPPVRRADIIGTHFQTFHLVALRFQLTDNPCKAVRLEANDARRIFRQHPQWTCSLHNLQKRRPEPSFIGRSLSLSGTACGLARHAPCDQINSGQSLGQQPRVFELWNGWPVLCENLQAEGVRLALPLAGHAGAVQPQIKATDTREETAIRHAGSLLGRQIGQLGKNPAGIPEYCPTTAPLCFADHHPRCAEGSG